MEITGQVGLVSSANIHRRYGQTAETALAAASCQSHDKKVRWGVVHFILLETIGRPLVVAGVTDSWVDEALDEIQRRY